MITIRVRRVVAVLVIGCLLLAATEIAVRRLDPYEGIPSVVRYDPVRIAKLFPYVGRYAGQDVLIDRLGFRDYQRVPPLEVEKRQPVMRVMAFGDSYTFGAEISVEASYPLLTERALTASRPEKRWEVINAGVSGYDVFQELSYMRETVDLFRPDLVVLAYTLNDIGPTPFVRDGGWRSLFRPATDWLSEHSYAWHYVPDLWARLRSPGGPPALATSTTLPSGAWFFDSYRPASASFAAVAGALGEIDALLTSRGIPLVVLNYGELNLRSNAGPADLFCDVYPFGSLHRQIAEVVAKGRGRLLDAAEVLGPLPARTIYERDAHPGPTASQAIAGALARCVVAVLEAPGVTTSCEGASPARQR